MLKDKCKVSTSTEEDLFIGIKYSEDNIKITFPLGFTFKDDSDETLRKDILLLINVLANNNDKTESENLTNTSEVKLSDFPLAAYLYVIKDYLAHGYYKNFKVEYINSRKGKINWHRTINTCQPALQNANFVYLDYITKKTLVNENDIFTLIHQYCVYVSFIRIGWLFTSSIPQKPSMPFNKILFIKVLNEKLKSTFNDDTKQLTLAMLKIVTEETDKGLQSSSFLFGTSSFYSVWETMIDKVFGENNKKDFYPHTAWNIVGKGEIECDDIRGTLRPDTIMIENGDVFVLDAKYYKPRNHPGASDINKQITYGEQIEYMVNTNQLPKNSPISITPTIYNAFILPFASKSNAIPYHYLGTAYAKWRTANKSYENVLGFYLDVRYLMSLTHRKNTVEISKLADEIREKLNNNQHKQ